MKKLLLSLFALTSLNAMADCPGMTVLLNPINPMCAGSCNGSNVASVSGGSGNYAFSYLNSTFAPISTTQNIFNLCAGTYYFVVDDITNGCVDTTTFTLTEPVPVVGTIMNGSTSCFGGSDGVLVAVATGGTPPYTYSWSNGATGPTTMGLPAGVYICTITDANGCATIVTGIINDAPQLSVVTTGSVTTCGQCTGMVAAGATGGTGAITYLWMPGNFTQPTMNNVCAGVYDVIVTDANGCTAMASYTVMSAGGPTVTASSTPSSCGACDGTVTVTESGGTGPYIWEVNSIQQTTNGNFSNMCSGNYVASVTDASGCVGFATVNVGSTGIAGLTITDSVTNESGAGLNDGSIDITVNGSTGPYTFLWSNGATSEDIYSLAAGNYSVTITDANSDCVTYYFTLTTTPAYGYITGTLYNDLNTNCIYDAGDVPYINQYVSVNGYWGYTNSVGYYSIWVPTGSYTVTPYNQTYIETACGTSQTVTVTNGSTISGVDFAYSIPAVYDVCVSVWSSGIVPGFNGAYSVYLVNSGTMPADGNVCLVLPSPLTFVSSIPSGASISGDTICFSYSNLLPGTTGVYYITFNTPVSLPLGTPMVAFVNAAVTNGTDINPGCNTFAYTRLVSGSFDPNDKSVSPSDENGNVGLADDELTYLIRFQNTGTGPAVNIVVTDTLSSLLDIQSLEMLSGSHSYVVELLPGNIVRWKFNNIMLPDSGSNEPGSHGYIQFRINTLNAPSAGQVVNNTANIYFDFNAPVITNTTVTTYITNIGIEETAENKLSVYPNPATDVLYVNNRAGGTAVITVYDIAGKVISTHQTSQSLSTVDLSTVEAGVYFVRSESANGSATVKFIKK